MAPSRAATSWAGLIHRRRVEHLAGRGNSERRIADYEAWAAANLPLLTAALAGAEVRVRIGGPKGSPGGPIVQRILADGRFRTQHETGRAAGILDITAREHAEESLFGCGERIAPGNRPVYGYLAWPGLPERGHLARYGDVVARLRPSVHRRTTWTGGDSLYHFQRACRFPIETGLVPAPLLAPHFDAVDPDAWNDVIRGSAGRPSLTELRDHGIAGHLTYIEAQVHRGVTVSDIAELVFTGAPPNRLLVPALARAGIAWRHHPTADGLAGLAALDARAVAA